MHKRMEIRIHAKVVYSLGTADFSLMIIACHACINTHTAHSPIFIWSKRHEKKMKVIGQMCRFRKMVNAWLKIFQSVTTLMAYLRLHISSKIVLNINIVHCILLMKRHKMDIWMCAVHAGKWERFHFWALLSFYQWWRRVFKRTRWKCLLHTKYDVSSWNEKL